MPCEWNPNRVYCELRSNLIVDSCFPSGNLYSASIISDLPLTLAIDGNPDVAMDSGARYWLYFRLKIKDEKTIRFVLKRANHLRKFINQTKYRPYMVYSRNEKAFEPCSYLDLSLTESNEVEGEFQFKLDKKLKEELAIYYFAMYNPYTPEDLCQFLSTIKTPLNCYFHEETICYTVFRRKISLIYITSRDNIESFTECEPSFHSDLFHSDRPLKLKHCPVIFITGRVHPSETMSSFFIEGIIEELLNETPTSVILRKLFIFIIVPMLNPDGVAHGNFRFDHSLRNLNRFYGHSSIEHTPSIFAAETLIQHYRSDLFMYIDTHAHLSPKQSFIYGNYTQNVSHAVENRLFCRLMEMNSTNNCNNVNASSSTSNTTQSMTVSFSKAECEFSKRNMSAQEKYDEYSKLYSGRVFVGTSEENQIFHSYTLELMPYAEGSKRNTVGCSKDVAKGVLHSILDLMEINPESKINKNEFLKIKNNCLKEAQNDWSRRLSMNRKDLSNEMNLLANLYIEKLLSFEEYIQRITKDEELLEQPLLVDFFQKIMPIEPQISENEKNRKKIKLSNIKIEPEKIAQTEIFKEIIPSQEETKHDLINKKVIVIEFDEKKLLTEEESIKERIRSYNKIESKRFSKPFEKLKGKYNRVKTEFDSNPREINLMTLSKQKLISSICSRHKLDAEEKLKREEESLPTVNFEQMKSSKKQNFVDGPFHIKSFVEHILDQVKSNRIKHYQEIVKEMPIFPTQQGTELKIFAIKKNVNLEQRKRVFSHNH